MQLQLLGNALGLQNNSFRQIHCGQTGLTCHQFFDAYAQGRPERLVHGKMPSRIQLRHLLHLAGDAFGTHQAIGEIMFTGGIAAGLCAMALFYLNQLASRQNKAKLILSTALFYREAIVSSRDHYVCDCLGIRYQRTNATRNSAGTSPTRFTRSVSSMIA